MLIVDMQHCANWRDKMTYEEMLKKASTNSAIFDMIVKAHSILCNPKYEKILVSVSGGADSDIMVDLCENLVPKKVHYVWFDTGIEYQATKDHLNYLENKYGIEIVRQKPDVPVPLGNKKYGQPFLSKLVSEHIQRLQHNDFKWEDKPYDELIKEYPNCKSSIIWWTNHHEVTEGFRSSMFNINYHRYLKEYMVENPPTFKISQNCCFGAKKNVSHKYLKCFKGDLILMGVRKSENGIRSATYKSCFTEKSKKYKIAQYRPLFWLTDYEREQYEHIFKIKHSRCYTEYGFSRTGCAGCPFGKQYEDELVKIKRYEPKLYVAITNIFSNSYEYTRGYLKFRREHIKLERGQRSLF